MAVDYEIEYAAEHLMYNSVVVVAVETPAVDAIEKT